MPHSNCMSSANTPSKLHSQAVLNWTQAHHSQSCRCSTRAIHSAGNLAAKGPSLAKFRPQKATSCVTSLLCEMSSLSRLDSCWELHCKAGSASSRRRTASLNSSLILSFFSSTTYHSEASAQCQYRDTPLTLQEALDFSTSLRSRQNQRPNVS